MLQAEPCGTVRVRYPGMARGAAGPDFKDAVLETEAGGVICGDVEVHVRASDWYGHGHSGDPAYDNVVLHVVGAATRNIDTFVSSGRRVPVAVLPDSLVGRVVAALPCSGACTLGPEGLSPLLRASGYERLRWRAAAAAGRIRSDGAVETLGALVARVLGYSANAAPLQALGEYVCQPATLTALCEMGAEERTTAVLGLAGLLPSGCAGVVVERTSRPAVSGTGWRQHGVYPNNSAVRRVVALADMLPSLDSLAAVMLDWVASPGASFKDAERRFVVRGEGYWRSHYDFGRDTAEADLVGPSKAASIVLEAVLPWLCALADVTADNTLRHRTVARYASCPGPRLNSVLRHMMRQLGLAPRGMGALEAQGLLHVFREYCMRGLCCVCPLAVVEMAGGVVSREPLSGAA